MAKSIKSGNQTGLTRSFSIDREKLNEDKRTVELAFSSEEPVERWGENEVLSHDKGDYDFSRLNADHPLLLGHNERDPLSQIGVVESAKVDKEDKKGRAVVRFSKSPLAEQIFQDVKDGIRKLVSVGYDRTGLIESKKSKDNMVTNRYRWKPTHIAIVPVPADETTGIGRSAESTEVDSPQKPNAESIINSLTAEEKNRMRILLDSTPAAGGGGTVTVDETKVRNEAREEAKKGYKTRAKEITTIADALVTEFGDRDGGEMAKKIRGMANDALAGEHCDEPVNDFKLRCMTDILKAKPAEPIGLEEVADANDQKRYSIIRGIQNAYVQREKGGAGLPPIDTLEGRIHDNILKKARSNGGLGFTPAGFLAPFDSTVRPSGMTVKQRRERGRMTRDMQATIFPSGGAFVPTLLELPVIEILRNMEVLEQTGWVRTLSGLSGNVVIPRQDAAATAYVVAEIAALAASQQILGQISLSPKRVGATQNYSKQLVFQSAPDIESFIRQDLFAVIALQWDYLGLNGQGAGSQPLGIMNTPGVQSIVFGATPTYKQLVSMQTALRKANVRGAMSYASTPATKGSLRTVAVTLTGATTVVGGASNAIWTPDDELAGEPAVESNQVPGDQIILGAEGECIKALWAGLDIVTDIYTKAANAEVVLTFNTWGDFALRHPQAFNISADSGAQ